MSIGVVAGIKASASAGKDNMCWNKISTTCRQVLLHTGGDGTKPGWVTVFLSHCTPVFFIGKKPLVTVDLAEIGAK